MIPAGCASDLMVMPGSKVIVVGSVMLIFVDIVLKSRSLTTKTSPPFSNAVARSATVATSATSKLLSGVSKWGTISMLKLASSVRMLPKILVR